MRILLCTLITLLISGPLFASKMQRIQDAVKTKCSKDLPKPAAMKAVKAVFNSCVPGTEVNVDGCSIKCLKSNDGVSVGG